MTLAPKYENGIPISKPLALKAEIKAVHGTAQRWTTDPAEIALFARIGEKELARNQIAPDEWEGAILFCRTAGPASSTYNRTGVRGSRVAMRYRDGRWLVFSIELEMRLPREPLEVKLKMTPAQEGISASRFRYFKTGERDLD